MTGYSFCLSFQCFLTGQPVKTLYPGVAATEVSALLILLAWLRLHGSSLLRVPAVPARCHFLMTQAFLAFALNLSLHQ